MTLPSGDGGGRQVAKPLSPSRSATSAIGLNPILAAIRNGWPPLACFTPLVLQFETEMHSLCLDFAGKTAGHCRAGVTVRLLVGAQCAL